MASAPSTDMAIPRTCAQNRARSAPTARPARCTATLASAQEALAPRPSNMPASIDIGAAG